jgi:sulfate transport system permease protein
MGTRAFTSGWQVIIDELTRSEALYALKLSLITTVLATVISTIFGTLLAYTLVRYQFRGKQFVSSLVELPLALPPVVAGFMLILTFGPRSLLGAFLESFGMKIVFAIPGLVIALLFVTFPFVVRSVQSVLEDLRPESEEAAKTTGASNWQTFWHVTFPEIRQGIYAGTMLAFARALGAFGSVAVVSGMIIGYTQTAPLYVWQTFMDFNLEGAFAMSLLLGITSFGLMFIIEMIRRRHKCQ